MGVGARKASCRARFGRQCALGQRCSTVHISPPKMATLPQHIVVQKFYLMHLVLHVSHDCATFMLERDSERRKLNGTKLSVRWV